MEASGSFADADAAVARRLATATEVRDRLRSLGALTQDRDRARIVRALNAFVRDGAGATFRVLEGTAQVMLSTTRQSGVTLTMPGGTS